MRRETFLSQGIAKLPEIADTSHNSQKSMDSEKGESADEVEQPRGEI
jgi:hypothetical protein